jgi:hypothetical protein
MLAATSDGGKRWQRVGVPATSLRPSALAGITGITFANSRTGWLYGPQLWATHDGGQHWTRIPVKGLVTDVVASGGFVYASVTAAFGDKTSLLEAGLASNTWRPVRSLPASGLLTNVDQVPAVLTAYGNTVWVSVEHVYHSARSPAYADSVYPVLWRGVNGGDWKPLATVCATSQTRPDVPQGPGGVVATSAHDLLMICGTRHGSQVVLSEDGGATAGRRVPMSTRLAADIGDGSLAVPSGQAKTIVLAEPAPQSIFPPGLEHQRLASLLLRTTNSGRSWTRTAYRDHGAGFGVLQFTGPTVAWLIHGAPGDPTDQLLRSTNAGTNFKPVSF